MRKDRKSERKPIHIALYLISHKMKIWCDFLEIKPLPL